MAILEREAQESNVGFEKVIDSGSMKMALDVLQKDQYQFPEKSVIRELAANAVDSIKEREIAKLILTGKAKVSDYYVEREGDEYKDSKFNPDYFDLKWLSSKKEVEIIYKEGNGLTTRDSLTVIDYGVGLGGKRLELYFRLSASSKRLTTSSIGKYGIGAKVPLATGIDSYRVVTYHNGNKFAFDVYAYKVDSITEKFNSKGQINPSYTFENGYTCYYEETTELNHTEISLTTKKFHRSMYTDAVRQQLLYFDNVTYKVIDESGYEKIVPTKAAVIYEDEDIILSDNNQYSKPHIVIGGVCYSYINFLHLDLEDKQGNIGIKMDAENIDVSSSREVVKWTDKTRTEVTRKFNKVVDIASKEVEKQLNEKDFVKWLEKCSRVLSYNDSYSILGRLSRVIDKSAIKPTFPLDKTIKFKSPKEMLSQVNIREIYTQSNYSYKGGNKITIQRDPLSSWNTLQDYKIYYTDSSSNSLKDRYITHTQSDRFILLQIPEYLDEEAFKKGRVDVMASSTSGKVSTVEDQWQEYIAYRDHNLKIIELIKASTESINYDEVLVPEDFKKKLEESEKVEEDGTVIGSAIPELTPAEKRKLDERTVLYYPEKSSYDVSTSGTVVSPTGQTLTVQKRHNWIKYEPKISEVLEWEGTVIYGYKEDDEMLLTVAWIIEQQQDTTAAFKSTKFFDDTVKIVKIAQGIKKYFKEFTHVTEFFKKVIEYEDNGKEEKLLSMNNLFIKWYTGKRIADGLIGFEFLGNFSMFNQEISDKYVKLRKYQNDNYKDLSQYTKTGNMLGCTSTAFNAIIDYADSMAEAQIALEKEVIPGDSFTKIEAIDMDQYNLLQEVIEYATPLKNILGYVGPLTNTITTSISFELESEIKEIMRNKGYDS